MTSSIVTRDVRFRAEAKVASMTEMRRKAAVHVAAEVGPVWVDSVEEVGDEAVDPVAPSALIKVDATSSP